MEQPGKNNPSIQPSSRKTEEGDRFNRTLFAAVDALETCQIPHAMIGGVAASGLGRPRSTHDIDFFVRPEDAESALEALGKSGFRTEKTDSNWLFKGWKEDILVDIIFKSSGDIYFDDEMHQRSRIVEYHGKKLRAVSPEDLIIIKSAVHSEIGPHHWHDALSLLSHAELDWEYLLRRSRRAPRRLLALLIYAQSNDILVSNQVIHRLFRTVFEENTLKLAPIASHHMPPSHTVVTPRSVPSYNADVYLLGKIKDTLAHDERTGDQNIKILVDGNHILVRGECSSTQQREAVEEVIRKTAHGFEIDNQLVIPVLPGPEEAEVVS